MRKDSEGFTGMLGRSCRRDMSDDKCELFTAKWMISSRLNAGVSLLGAAELNVKHALRSIMKQGVHCKRMLYCMS